MIRIMDETLTFLLAHWPFLSVAGTLWIVGHFMERSVFTEARVQEYPRPRKEEGKRPPPDTRSRGEKLHHWFFYWGRDSLELHPFATAAIIGALWSDPEGLGWASGESIAYFQLAALTSLFGWLVLRMFGKRLGVDLPDKPKLPGE